MHGISPKFKRAERTERCIALAKPLRQHGAVGSDAARLTTVRCARH